MQINVHKFIQTEAPLADTKPEPITRTKSVRGALVHQLIP